MSSSTKKQLVKQTKEEPTFLEWLIHGKGTVSEPWPTAKELFENEKLQDKIKAVRKIVNNATPSSKK